MIVAVVLAAGESTRMGQPKALLPIHGVRFIEKIALDVNNEARVRQLETARRTPHCHDHPRLQRLRVGAPRFIAQCYARLNVVIAQNLRDAFGCA